ncbi:MAG: HAD family phosphatase [Chloroflexi bacterium]|nr:HAD family phosphatase [Chloroflexota bacterium]
MNPVRLVVLDIDGCLTPGEAKPWSLEAMDFIARLNRRARVDPPQFAVTLCTGRQEPYVEAIMQAIDAHMPAIYENGGGLYFPDRYHFAENPSFTPDMRVALDDIRMILRRALVEPGIGQFQPGKEVTLTLYPANAGITLGQLAELAARALDGRSSGFTVTASVSSVEILPDGIDKGAGVEWLSREIGIPLDNMAGIGDAPSDLSFLRKVGASAAPSNAHRAVKSAVQYVSPYDNGHGTMDILKRWMNG